MSEVYNVLNLVIQGLVWVAMIATFIVYHKQLRAMRDAARGQNILALINFLQAADVRSARELVRTALRNKGEGDWSERERRAAYLVCATYDVAGILVFQEKIVPGAVLVENWGQSIVDSFEILQSFVLEIRKQEISGPRHWRHFEKLYDSAKSNAPGQARKRRRSRRNAPVWRAQAMLGRSDDERRGHS